MTKLVREYQVRDKEGNPIGYPQKFESETPEEMIDLLETAHKNAASKLYETKLAVKLGTMMEPDPDDPITTFDEKPLTADERVRINNLIRDPKTADEGYQSLLEAKLGAPLEKVRKTLQKTEEHNRIESMRYEIELFKYAHPEYVDSEANKDTMIKFINKKQWALTKKNLELAFEELGSEGLLTVQVKPPATTETPVAAVVPIPVAATPEATPVVPAPPAEPVIPVSPFPAAAPISATPAEPVRVPSSSSGLGRANGSVQSPPAPPKAKGITRAELTKLSSEEYGRRLRTDKEFERQVKALLGEA